MEWRPIKDMPKDGSIFDVWNEQYGRICNCWWDDAIVGCPEGNITHFMVLEHPMGGRAYVCKGYEDELTEA